jgi:putative redox protein
MLKQKYEISRLHSVPFKNGKNMKIFLQRVNKACHMVAQNEDGNTIHIDGSPQIGGQNLGFRPMQLLAAGAAGCSSMDIIDILAKQRQNLTDLQVEVDAEREPDKVPSLFTKIHLHFILYGKLDQEKVGKAIALSLEKYCSVVKTLEKTAVITHTFEIKQ